MRKIVNYTCILVFICSNFWITTLTSFVKLMPLTAFYLVINIIIFFCMRVINKPLFSIMRSTFTIYTGWHLTSLNDVIIVWERFSHKPAPAFKFLEEQGRGPYMYRHIYIYSSNDRVTHRAWYQYTNRFLFFSRRIYSIFYVLVYLYLRFLYYWTYLLGTYMRNNAKSCEGGGVPI